MRAARVLIADDHAFVLETLVGLLNEKFDVVAAVTDGHLLVEAAVRLRPEVIVMDVEMPGLNGIEALERMRAVGMDARIIVLTIHANAELATAVIRAGASGFVLKHLAASELTTAIEQVLAGNIYRTPAVM